MGDNDAGSPSAAKLGGLDVADHDHGAAGIDGRPEGDELAALDLLARARGADGAGVRVARGVAMAGEVLGTGQRAGLEHRTDLGRDHARHEVGVASERALADHGVGGVGKHVCHGGEVHVEADVSQVGSDGAADLGGISLVARVPDLCHVGKALDVEQARAGDACDELAALLVDGKKRRYARADLLARLTGV